MKHKCVLPVIIVILLIAGCNTDRNQAASPSGNTQNPPAATSPSCSDHEFIANDTLDKEGIMNAYGQNQLDTAQSMAELYINGIKNGLDLANDQYAIEVFDLLFDRQTLAVTNLLPINSLWGAKSQID